MAANLMPLIRQLQASGIMTVRALAAELNARAVRTARGGVWHPTTVQNLLTRGNA
ncbi:MAG: recombinase family protein [Acetobacteraceae bacterium]|nr:recombinase family protein [Acetobacteraceae bacterium]